MSAHREYGYRPLRHTSRSIEGTVCDGCRCLCVIERTRLRQQYEEYYCEWRHEVVHPQVMECGHRKGA